MNLRRQFIVLLLFTAGMAVFILRLFWIQVVEAQSYSYRKVNLLEGALKQRISSIRLDDGRGDFTDRFGRPLTGRTAMGLAVFPEALPSSYSAEKLAKILGVKPGQWREFLTHTQAPSFYRRPHEQRPLALTAGQTEQIRAMSLPGLLPFPIRERYAADGVARHLIGFTAEDPQRMTLVYGRRPPNGRGNEPATIGEAGLEKTFDRRLRGLVREELAMFDRPAADASAGDGPKLLQFGTPSPLYPVQAVTTLDADIQREVERIMDRRGISEGAIVVLDAHNADIIAMASRPDYDPLEVDPERSGWRNRALTAYPPGSVFKTVVAAAALDTGAVKSWDRFYCGGELGRYGFSCWKTGGHGWLTLREGYAQSCNIAFARIAERLPAAVIDDYARKLGLARQVGLQMKDERGERSPQLDHEEAGRVFASSPLLISDPGIRIQTAIGQRDVRMTPLQGANLVVTLLNGGRASAPRAVRELHYRNHQLLAFFPEQRLKPEGGRISPRTAHALLVAMRETVTEGTGRSLARAAWPLAGKTGTAEVRLNGRPAEHQWFIGYGPEGRPRYAVAAVALNRPPGSKAIQLDAVRDVMDLLARRSGRPLFTARDKGALAEPRAPFSPH